VAFVGGGSVREIVAGSTDALGFVDCQFGGVFYAGYAFTVEFALEGFDVFF
jgi:hypothetical protein